MEKVIAKKQMKMNMKNIFLIPLILLMAIGFTACGNQEIEFNDYDYSTVYFAYQSPVRTLTMGEDIFDTSMDNQHKCKIMATIGGVYTNTNDVILNIAVDNSICSDIKFKDNTALEAMPSNYYSLASNQIVIHKGSSTGGVEVQLTDAFFADPLALTRHYVIPVIIKSVQNADSILSGTPKFSLAVLTHTADWEVQPKNYMLYAVKYINTWTGNYLRRGVDVITNGSANSTVVRHKQFVENDEVVSLKSSSLSQSIYPIGGHKNIDGINIGLKVNLTFDNSMNCTVAPNSTSYQVNDSIKVYNVSVSGNGSFVKRGEKKSWGNLDRDALYLKLNASYQIETKYPKLGKATVVQTIQYNTTDTLVARDRGVAMETFEYIPK
jgi:hypothetical protein